MHNEEKIVHVGLDPGLPGFDGEWMGTSGVVGTVRSASPTMKTLDQVNRGSRSVSGGDTATAPYSIDRPVYYLTADILRSRRDEWD